MKTGCVAAGLGVVLIAYVGIRSCSNGELSRELIGSITRGARQVEFIRVQCGDTVFILAAVSEKNVVKATFRIGIEISRGRGTEGTGELQIYQAADAQATLCTAHTSSDYRQANQCAIDLEGMKAFTSAGNSLEALSGSPCDSSSSGDWNAPPFPALGEKIAEYRWSLAGGTLLRSPAAPSAK